MSLYTKALKHIDMNRVKELREEKIKRKKIADEIREQIREELRNLSSPEFSNWREGIAEGMTSSGMFNTTLPAQGDVDLGDVTSPIQSLGSSPGSSQSGNTYTSGPASAGIPPEVNGGFIIDIDTSEFDTLVFELSPGTIDSFEIITANGSGYTDYNISTSAGRKVLSLKSVDRKKGVSFAFSFSKSSGGSIGTNVIRNLTFQRRTPMNVFVSLDSPEATSFIRTDPTMQGLSAEDRKKKLIDMLDAGDEYLLKYLGMTGSKARPSDTTMPDSWDQAAGGATDAMSDDLYNWVNKTYGLPAAEWKKENPTKPDNSNPFLPKGSYVPKASGGKDYGNVASAKGPYGTPGADKPYVRKGYKDKDGKFVDYDNPSTWPSILKKAGNNKDTMDDRWRAKATAYTDSWKAAHTKHVNAWKKQLDLAHHEPEGEVLSEKKKLKSVKDITSKIPGYYDGKPAPLGFPMQEPPKMVNGFHPDLVGGKKIANRFNRLDPQSAKAMPPTGNPHIDKKVRAAAKKPK